MSLVPAVTTAISPRPRSVRVAEHADELCRFVPLGVGDHVADLAKHIGGRPRDQDVRSPSGELLKYPDDLLAGLALSEYDLGKALPFRTSVIDLGIADVFVGKAFQPLDRRFALDLAAG